MKTFLFVLMFSLFSTPSQAKQFEIFDGQFYNGLHYPLVDAIEWGEQEGKLPWMEFHIHSDKQIELTAVPGEKNGKPVLWLMYDLAFRGERICRHIIAPAHFREGMKLFAYKDTHDPDYVNIYFSTEPKVGKHLQEYKTPNYEPCSDEMASNKPDAAGRSTASVGVPAPKPGPSTALPQAEKKEGKGLVIDYDNQALPFSF